MKKLITIFSIFILVPLVACNTQETTTGSTDKEVKTETKAFDSKPIEVDKDVSERLISFLKSKYGSKLPPEAQISVSDFQTTELGSFNKGNYNVAFPGRGEQKVPFLISNDKKYIIIGSDTAVNTGSFEKSSVPGFKQGQIQFGRQPLPILISDDGKHLIIGELLDSTVDPLKEIRDKISLANVPYKGAEDASVTIVEYSDFQCPFCKRGSDMLPLLLEEFKGKIKIVFKQMPLPNHNWAKQASIASLCSYEQGNDKFWDFHDIVFNRQQQININNAADKFKEFAEEIKIDSNKFSTCINSEEIAARVEKDMNEAISLGINSTPTFVVDGIVVPGANLPGLKSAINSRLADKS